jgi:hypothetical protein
LAQLSPEQRETECVVQVAADLVSKLPYILPPVGVLILSLLGFAVFM